MRREKKGSRLVNWLMGLSVAWIIGNVAEYPATKFIIGLEEGHKRKAYAQEIVDFSEGNPLLYGTNMAARDYIRDR